MNWHKHSPWLIGGWALSWMISALPVTAQIAGDGTLGTQVNGSLTAPCNGFCSITNGAVRGSNLFHSFQQFSLPNADIADFQIAPATQNVIVRVTGVGQPFISNINGTIQTSNPANFFLLNPNGIVFGPGATLNIGGAFLATTANRMQFADGTELRTDDPAPLLTINVPIGLQFNAAPKNIQMQGSFLSAGFTDSFSDFALIGGNVSLDDAILDTPGQRIELGGLASTGNVGLTVNHNQLRLEFPNSFPRADVSLTNRSVVSVQANGGGEIAIHARNLDILGRSGMLAGITQFSGSPTTQAGDILLDATGTITLVNSAIGNGLRQGAEGQSGNILIRAGSLMLSDDASIDTVTQGQGDAGNIVVKADSVFLTGRNTALLTAVDSDAIGKGGTIRIETRSLSLQDGAGLTASTFGQGDAGNIVVQASGAVSLLNGQIFSRVNSGRIGRGGDVTIQAESFFMEGDDAFITTDVSASDNFGPAGRGRGGDIKIQAGSLISLKHGAVINASTSGNGDAGNITLQTGGLLSLVDSNIFTVVDEGALGQGGDITIRANSIVIKEDNPLVSGQTGIASSTFGQGNSGDIDVRVTDAISLIGTGGLITGVGEDAVGNGGNIRVEARSLTVTDGAQLFADTFGVGDAGSIWVNSTDFILLSGVGVTTGFSSGFQTNTQEGALGRSGNINVTTRSLSILDGATVSATTRSNFNGGNVIVIADAVNVAGAGQVRTSTASSGNAGNITLKVSDRVTLTGQNSGLFANTTPGSTGNGGSIDINSRVMSIQDSAGVAVDSQGSGRGGDLSIQTGTLTLKNQAFLTAETASNQGGNITIQASDLLLMRFNSLISTTAGTEQAGGDGGNITIKAPFVIGVLSENSDIRANAFTGRGGRVDITAQGIYGLQFQRRLTPRSDITASSEFGISGEVILNTPDVDPSRGLIPIAIDLVDPSQLIVQTCPTNRSTGSTSEFVVTGRGGLPTSPDEKFRSSSVLTNWSELPPETEIRSSTQQAPSNQNTPQVANIAPLEIIEAQGWIVDETGTVILTAEVPASPRTTYNQLPTNTYGAQYRGCW